MLDDATLDALGLQALAARRRAYAPYSHFLVGAALLCDDGAVIEGCNVENASYGLCICAERTAVAAAVAQGRRHFRAVAIATASTPPATPCGMCRQVLAEFTPPNGDIDILLVNDAGARVRTTLRALFPGIFDMAQLQSGQSPASTTEPAR
ncbi:MAG: cytidine deaminase [Deltaproteobacteria bacterium]|nr:cytidine deaminase [Deltaproteobacteria bacterium]